MARWLAAMALAVGWMLGGCYDVPKDVCGFQCGPNFSCPDGYTCGVGALNAGRCVLSSELPNNPSCPGVDAGIRIDADTPPLDTNPPPTVLSRVPVEFADNVPVTTTITVTFSEAISSASVDPNTFTLSDNFGSIGGTFAFPDPATVVFTPLAPLREGQAHFVTLSNITDLEGAFLAFTQWNFSTVPDQTPPTIAGQFPAPDATDVGIDSRITVLFSEEVQNVSQTTFTLRDGDGNTVFGTPTFDQASLTAEFHYDAFLLPNTTYTARLSGAITDGGGNPLTGAPVSWSFTTGADTLPPNLVSRSPAVGSPPVNPNVIVSVAFDEEVLGVTGTTFTLRQGATVIPATITYFDGSASAQLDPTPTLGSNLTYTVTLDTGITDLAGNPLVGTPITWTFTTQTDTTSPTLIGRTPAFGATNVPLDSVVTATFSEDVTNVTSSTFTLTPGGGVVSYSAATRTATLVPSSALALDTVYSATVTTGITDLAGNPLNGPVTWTFTSKSDVTPPTAMLTTPLDNATGVATTTPIVVLFDEPVNNVSGATFRVNAGGGIGGSFASAMGGREHTFTPTAPLPANTTVTVTLTTGITDLAANPLAGPVNFSFETAP